MPSQICWNLAWGTVFPCDAGSVKASDQISYLFKLSVDIRTLAEVLKELVVYYKIRNDELMADVIEEAIEELRKALEIVKENVTEDDSKSVRA